MEYLVTMTTHVPAGTPDETVAEVRAREAAHTRELAASGHILRLWRPPLAPGEWRTLGLFAAADGAELEQVLVSMPLRVWRSDQVTELARHSNDPAGLSPAVPGPAGPEGPAPSFSPRSSLTSARARRPRLSVPPRRAKPGGPASWPRRVA